MDDWIGLIYKLRWSKSTTTKPKLHLQHKLGDIHEAAVFWTNVPNSYLNPE
jgi:hypothetical protein